MSAMRSLPDARREPFWPSLRAALGALVLFGVGGALLGAAGCGDRQVVVLSVTDRPDPVSGLGIYYRVDGGPLRSGGLKPANGVVPNYDLFGIALDRGVSGTLSVDVYAHQDGSPCIRSRGHVEVALSGDPKQQSEITMVPVTGVACDTRFPGGVFPQNPKIWGSAINDLWIVGDGGSIVRWNGVYLETVPLPDDLKAALPQLPNFRAVSGSDSRHVWIVGDQGTVLRWNGDVLYWFSQLSSKYPATLPTDVQRSLDVTDVWVEPGTRDVTLVAWNPGTSALYFGFGTPNDDFVQVINPAEESNSGVDILTGFVPRKPLAIACSRAGGGECWAVGEKGLALAHRMRSPLTGYKDASAGASTNNPPSPTFRAVNVFTDPGNPEQYELYGFGDGGAFFAGSRQVFGTTVVPASPTGPSWMRPAVNFTASAQAKPAMALVGGSGGYLARVSNPNAMGYSAQQIAVDTKEDISDLAIVREHFLILTKGGQLLDIPVP